MTAIQPHIILLAPVLLYTLEPQFLALRADNNILLCIMAIFGLVELMTLALRLYLLAYIDQNIHASFFRLC